MTPTRAATAGTRRRSAADLSAARTSSSAKGPATGRSRKTPPAPASIPYSSYGLIKGALVEDTRAAFRDWDLDLSKRTNLDRLRATNSIGAATQAWLRQVCTTLSRRFDPAGADRALVMAAATEIGQRHWRPLLLWHMANRESLLGDALLWIWTVFEAGGDQLQTPQLHEWLLRTIEQGHPEVADWSESTQKRVAGGLLKAGVDFGLLQGKVKRRFTPYYLPDEPLLYILLQALETSSTTAAALTDPRWLWFRLTEAELEHRLLQLHQARVIRYYRAGSVVDLKLPVTRAQDLVQEAWQ